MVRVCPGSINWKIAVESIKQAFLSVFIKKEAAEYTGFDGQVSHTV